MTKVDITGELSRAIDKLQFVASQTSMKDPILEVISNLVVLRNRIAQERVSD
jgi:hypothetical protein